MLGTGSVTVKSLTIGASEHTQTLEVASSNSINADLTTSSGIANGAHGAIVLTNSETAANNVTIAGPITNAGSITTEKAVGGQRSLQGSLTNTGTLAINAPTSFNSTKALLSNEGAIDLATGVALTGTVETTVVNGAGGKIVAAGSGLVDMEPGTTFNEAGTTSGTKPVVLRDAALIYSGSGESLIEQLGEASTLSGSIGSKQSLVLASYNSENVKSTASASFTNSGSITLTNTETAANNASLAITSPAVLTNEGTITTEKVNGGARNLQGNITNGSKGTLAIKDPSTFSTTKAALLNEGAISITAGQSLQVNNEASVNNAAGSIVVGEGGAMQFEPATKLTEGAGTTSGRVALRDANLIYSGTGTSTIFQLGEGSTLSGNIGPKQALVLESYNSENVRTTAAASFTNEGSITLTNSETAANNAALAISTGVLTNDGTITTEKAIGGQRNLNGNITNASKGTLAINAPTLFNLAGAALINEGAIDIALGVTLSASNGQTISNEGGGSITTTGTGALVQSNGTFNEGLGKTTTAKSSEPVILDDATLNYTNKGASKIAVRGVINLTGAVNKGQTLEVESNNSQNTEVTSGGFVNSGTILLTNAETAGNGVRLKLGGATLDNKGKLEVLYPNGGTRTIEGSLINEKTLTLANGKGNPLQIDGEFTQTSKGTTTITIEGASTKFGRLAATEAVSIEGKLSLKQKKFTATAGEMFGIVSGASRTGEFSAVKGNAVKGGSLHYIPHYTATAVNLIVE
jgi:hypothetical protein